VTLHPNSSGNAAREKRNLENAFRTARAGSHSCHLDSATQTALDSIVAFSRVAADRMREIEGALVQARNRIAALEAQLRSARR
jgi:hypothetical protein